MEVLKANHEFFVSLYIFVALLISVSQMERNTGLYPKMVFLHDKKRTGWIVYYLIIFVSIPFFLALKLLSPIEKAVIAFYEEWLK